MSQISHSSRSLTLFAAGVRQMLIAGAAVAGVAAIAGCQPPPAALAKPGNPPAMGSALSRQPESKLVESSGARRPAPTGKPIPQADDQAFASAQEQQRADRQAVVDLVNEALAPSPVPLPRKGSALGVAEHAVTPLADTLTAIDAAQRTIVENLRNNETPGFKSSRTAIGDGRDVASQLDTAQGELQVTQRALDVAVQGDGFLQIRIYTPENPDGSVAFTRNGRLFMNRNGDLVVGQIDGYLLIPPIKLPPAVTQVTIGQNGAVEVIQAATDATKQVPVGRLNLVMFTDPSALRPLGGGLYAETEASGQAVELPAGERSTGLILQGHLEGSNVDLMRERLRLRFLQNWRSHLLGALDGPAAEAVRPQPSKETSR